MLLGIPKILSPELLAVLCSMGHSDVIVLGDGNFPTGMFEREYGVRSIRADGHNMPELLDAILQLMPLDNYCDAPVQLMQTMDCDKDMDIPIWKEYEKIVQKYDSRGSDAIGYVERFQFYDLAKKAYCIVHTGEEAVYANVMLQKGVVK